MEQPCSLKHCYESYPRPVDLVNAEGQIIWTNPAGMEYRKDQTAYQEKVNILELQNPEFYSCMQKASGGKAALYSGPDPVDLFLGSIQVRNCEIIIQPFNRENKGMLYVMIHQKEDEEKEKYSDGNRITLAINNYLRHISHEIRTPLNWIIGFSGLISEENDLGKIMEYNRNISRGGNQILSSFEQLIDMAGMIKNEVEIDKSCFSLDNFLQELKSLLETEVKELELDVEIRLNPSFNNLFREKFIFSDRNKLQHIMIHLLHNSLKHTRKGYIEAGCREMPDGMFLFYIRDSGIGICSEMQHHIRDIFRKDLYQNLSTITGKSMGLIITNNYVKMLGGSIWVESQPDKETTFYFTVKNMLSQKQANPPANMLNMYTPHRFIESLRKFRILKRRSGSKRPPKNPETEEAKYPKVC